MTGSLLALLAASALADQGGAAVPVSAPPAPAQTRGDASGTVGTVEVTVRAAPVLGTIQHGVLDYSPAFFTPVRPGTAMDMVNWLPGFVFEDTRDMRGIEGSTGNVLIDGKPPTSKTDTLQSVLSRIPAAQVERIDIIVGGAPGIDMHGRALIANVILKVSATIQRVVTVADHVDDQGREYPSLSLTSSEKRGDKTLQVSLDAFRNMAVASNVGYGDWIRYAPTGAIEYTANSSFQTNGPIIIGSGVYQFPFAGGTMKFNGSERYIDSRNYEKEELTSTTGSFYWDNETRYDQGEIGANYERPVGGGTTLEVQLLERPQHLNQRNDYELPPTPYFTRALSNLNEQAIRTVARVKRSATFNIEAYAEYDANAQKNHTTQLAGGVFQPVPGGDVKVKEDRGEAGITASWKPNPKLGLDTSLKVESSDIAATGDVNLEHRLTYWKPRALLAWSITPSTQLRLRAEREVGQISFTNFITLANYSSSPSGLQVGNVGLRPQRDWVGEAVLQHGFWDGADITLTARHLWLQDVIDLAPIVTDTGDYAQIQNIGNGTETDLAAVLTFPMKRFGLKDTIFKASVTSVEQNIVDPVTGLERPLSYQSPLKAELHWAQDFPQQHVNWGVDAFYANAYAAYRPYGDLTVGAYPHVNIFVEYRPTPQTVVRAEVQNLPAMHVRSESYDFSGLKYVSPLLQLDVWRLSNGPILYLRLRRTFT